MKWTALILFCCFSFPFLGCKKSPNSKDGFVDKTANDIIKKAEAGDADAQYSLGQMYYNGEGVTQGYKEAFKWYRMAAEQGHAGAQYKLGLMYINSFGVGRDEKEAVKWFCKAAEQGLGQAQLKLAWIYSDGYGVVEDDKEAVKWYRKAAEQGYASAFYNLSLMYYNGEGVNEDNVEAYKWHLLAGVSYDNAAFKSHLTQKMTPEQISEAQKLAKAFIVEMEKKADDEN